MIAPLEAKFSNKKVLYTLTVGPLLSPPMNVLVTKAPTGSDSDHAAMAATSWLNDRYALVTIPAVSSLRTLRCFSTAESQRRKAGCLAESAQEAHVVLPRVKVKFLGISDPVLDGKPLGQSDQLSRGPGPGGCWYSIGEIANVDCLRQLPRLRGAAEELHAFMQEFRGSGAAVVTRFDATKTRVKTDDAMKGARVLLFSTHALNANQVGDIGESGIVLTPPKEGTKDDDGLLTGSEIAKLQLSADLVILSGCNTGRAKERLGSDGFSGLARAFFYAGARAMLVSYWSVADLATRELMKHIFDRLDTAGGKGRVFAFQSATQMMKNRPEWSEPRYWASFVLIGKPK